MCVPKQIIGSNKTTAMASVQVDKLSEFTPKRRACTKTTSSGSEVIIWNPHVHDVLCGREKLSIDHEGSRHFRTMIECYREKYAKALTKHDKTCVIREIYENLKLARSRFLKRNHELKAWEELNEPAARDKIGHALRFANRKTNRAKDVVKCSENVGSCQEASPTKAKPSLAQPPAPTSFNGSVASLAPGQQLERPLHILASLGQSNVPPSLSELITRQAEALLPPFLRPFTLPREVPQDNSGPKDVCSSSHGAIPKGLPCLHDSFASYSSAVGLNGPTTSSTTAGVNAPIESEDTKQSSNSAPQEDWDFDKEVLSVLD